jgi:uncharacterized membrane protein YphA (DoxX/SURF4 family)
MSTRWASGTPRSRVKAPAPPVPSRDPAPPAAQAPQTDRSAGPQTDLGAGPQTDLGAGPRTDRSAGPQTDRSADLSGGPSAAQASQAGLPRIAEQAAAISAEWAPTAGRILLGLVFFWFGYHELVQPGGWTQYVPVVNESSSLAVILVLVHGWLLFVTAAALVAGIAPRLAAAVASVLLLEIVISLAVTGLSPTAVRDVGVLGLAVCLTGCKNQRLVLRG